MLCFLFVGHVYAVNKGQRERVLGISLSQEGEIVSIDKVYLSYGYRSKSVLNYEYVLHTIDESGKTINELDFAFQIPSFSPPTNLFDPKTGKQIIVPKLKDKSQETLFVPFFSDIRYVAVFDESGKELSKVDIADHVSKAVLGKIKETKRIEVERGKEVVQEKNQIEKIDIKIYWALGIGLVLLVGVGLFLRR